MNVYEAIERAKKSGCAENTPNDILKDAIKRLEIQIAKKAEIDIKAFNDDSVLLACGGGVADGYDDMYDAYIKREAARICENMEWLNNYDAIFMSRYDELRKEIIRNSPAKRFEFR